MSFRAYTAAEALAIDLPRKADTAPPKPDSTAKLVAYALAGYVNAESAACFPTVSTLAERAHLSVSATREALRRLEAAGFIRTELRPRPGDRHRSSIYTFCTLENTADANAAPAKPGLTGDAANDTPTAPHARPPSNSPQVTPVAAAAESWKGFPEPLFPEKLAYLWNEFAAPMGATKQGVLSPYLIHSIRDRYEECQRTPHGVRRTLTSIGDWATFFAWIARSPWLTGGTPQYGDKPFSASLSWLTKTPETFFQVRDGKRHPKDCSIPDSPLLPNWCEEELKKFSPVRAHAQRKFR